MSARARDYVPAFLLCSVLAAACDGNGADLGVTSTAPTSIRSAQSTRITAEPETVVPQMLTSAFCAVEPPFQASVSVVVRAGDDVIVQGLGFEFIDRSGTRTAPAVTPSSSTAASIPTTLPVPLPSSSPVPIPGPGSLPIPGQGSIPGLLVSPGNLLTLPFLLQFECGVPASGTLVIVVATRDAGGDDDTSEARVRIGR